MKLKIRLREKKEITKWDLPTQEKMTMMTMMMIKPLINCWSAWKNKRELQSQIKGGEKGEMLKKRGGAEM